MAVLSRRTEEGENARRERRAALQARIGEATAELLRDGATYADLSVDRIARRAGVSRTTFYDYFSDKRDLLLWLASTLVTPQVAEAEEWREESEHLEADLQESLRRSIRMNREHAAVLGAVTEAASYDDEIREAWLAHQDYLIQNIEKRLEAERAAGRMANPAPLRATARAILWMTQQTTYQELMVRDELGEDEVLEALTELSLRGVRGRL
jgi:TetR/AcrR family transcriptional regulator, ethionamide resistance regulator